MRKLDEQMDDWNGTPRELWEQIKQEMSGDVQIRQSTFDTYYKPLELVSYEDDLFTVESPGKTLEWCKSYARGDLQRLLSRELQRKVVVWIIESVKPQPQLPLFAPEPDADAALLQSDAGDEFEKGYGPIPY